MRVTAAIALTLTLAAPAQASGFWERSDEDPDAEVARVNYEREMELGNEYAIQAANRGASSLGLGKLVMRAFRAYENAALARPDAAEPHYLAGLVLWSFFNCGASANPICRNGNQDPSIAERIATHWTAFEKLAPLDPRIDASFLFERALAHTNVATREHLVAAIDDYLESLRRTDLIRINVANAYGNLAENYMMVGRLEEALATYPEAIRLRPSTTTIYGYAVALDRDEQGTKARELIADLGPSAFEEFKRSVESGEAFYVPLGEVFYYFALAEESLGDPERAMADWDRFLASGAHAEFAARARANRDALAARKPRK
ncbi:MAG: tetratricopeptide repeat protein [Deltaproteobacteria bacterium]|nr:tetratricopeptide repeat protein [Deltaproteobacteria bacterium]